MAGVLPAGGAPDEDRAVTAAGDHVCPVGGEVDGGEAAEVTHAIRAGTWVMRSIPVLMYADPHYEMGQLPDEDIGWSPLLKNEAFRAALEEFAR